MEKFEWWPVPHFFPVMWCFTTESLIFPTKKLFWVPKITNFVMKRNKILHLKLNQICTLNQNKYNLQYICNLICQNTQTFIRLELRATNNLKWSLSLQKQEQSFLDELETSLEKFLEFEICYGKVLIFCRNTYPCS